MANPPSSDTVRGDQHRSGWDIPILLERVDFCPTPSYTRQKRTTPTWEFPVFMRVVPRITITNQAGTRYACPGVLEDILRPNTYDKSSDGHIRIGGIQLSELASTYGTPLYVMDLATILDRMRTYQKALAGWGMAHYAGKAFLCQAMAALVQRQGWGLDVVSGGELYTALQAGMDPKHIVFHGNAKSDDEIALGIEAGVGYFVVDSLEEMSRLDAQAARTSQRVSVLLRITPGIAAHTHEFIRTGEFDSKFGFATEGGAAEHALDCALAAEHLRLVGFHAHIGSQILEVEPFRASAEALLQFSSEAHHRYGFWPEILDIGGGFGVAYGPEDHPPDTGRLLAAVHEMILTRTPRGLSAPAVWIEPGRSVVADAGLTIYRVQGVKRTPGGRTFVTVDGGMGDNIRPVLYGARYRAELDQHVSGQTETVTVAGRYCESGDVLVEDARLSIPEPGSLLVVWTTGAYAYSMASQYNRVPRPGVVAVQDGKAQVWVERESWQEIMRLDRPLAQPESARS